MSAVGWFSIHLSARERNGSTGDAPLDDSPPAYDRAVRGLLAGFPVKNLKTFLDPESIRVRIETGAQRAYFKAQKCFSHPLLKNKLLIPGTNLERITMTVSIFTIVIVILQVVAEVLRVTAIDHKVKTRLLT